MPRKLPSVLDRFAGRDVDMAELESAMQQDIERRALSVMDRASGKRLGAFADGEHLPGLGLPAPRRPGPATADFTWEDEADAARS